MITRLYRSADKVVIHAEGCRHANPTRRWTWADDKSLTEIRAVVLRHELEPCTVCHPLTFGGPR